MKRSTAAFAVLTVVLLTGCSSTTTDSTPTEASAETQGLSSDTAESDESELSVETPVEVIEDEVVEEEVDVVTEEDSASGTVSQQNAFDSAQSYLSFSAFSKSGLIDQLEFEGYSTADANWALDNMVVDWNEQAAKSAQSYLEFSSFSRSGLIDQLEFEGYTRSQAEYGVDQVGL
jgi:colicin import membrane protein